MEKCKVSVFYNKALLSFFSLAFSRIVKTDIIEVHTIKVHPLLLNILIQRVWTGAWDILILNKLPGGLLDTRV